MPASLTSSAAFSHICPGPYFGSLNVSISDVVCWALPVRCLRFFGVSASTATRMSDMSFTRCAPKSAVISVAGTAHSFSV